MTSAGHVPSWSLRGIERLDAEPGRFWFGAWRNVNILVWESTADLHAVERLEHTIPPRVAAHPEGLSTVYIIPETAGPPPADVRAAFAAQGKRWRKTIACLSVVIEHTGFLGSAMRSAITGITLISPDRFKTGIHESIAEAAAWLPGPHQSLTGLRIDPAELQRVLESARYHDDV
jgi:hypothetical protein